MAGEVSFEEWVAFEMKTSANDDSLSNNERCVADSPETFKKCSKGDNSRRNNGPAIHALLQMLVVHLPLCITKPWLISQLESVANITDANSSLSTQCNVVALVSLVCQLPSHLWIVNRSCDQPTQQSMSLVLQALEDVMVPYVAESCWLPLYVTLHILQGVLTLQHTDSSESPLKQLVNHPLIAICIMASLVIVVLDSVEVVFGLKDLM